jgi:succinoglycan biosynthesis transport protein ExoP
MSEYPITAAPEDNRVQLREYLGILRMRKWTILLVALLVVGGAVFYSLRQTPVYRSEARLLVETTAAQAPPGTTTQVNMQTEAALVESAQVAELVAENLEVDETLEQLLRGLEVEVTPQTEILAVRYEATDPAVARQRAQAFASAYLTFRRERAQEELLAAAESFQKRKTDLEEERSKKENKIAELAIDDPQRQTLQNDINQLNGQIALLEQQISQVTPAGKLQVGDIVEPANLPGEPISPDYVRNIVLAVLMGLALGVGVAFLRERLDDRLRGRVDLERHLGAPVLAVIPKVATWRRRSDTPLVTVAEPRANTSEAYRTLRTSLLFAASQRDVKTIMVTSPQAGEGKTATAANLAVVLAQAQKRVILVSADLRKPRIHRFFGLSNQVGLTSILIGEAKPWEAVEDVGIENLKVVPSGPVPGNPAELLGSDAMGSLLQQFRNVADFVIVDSAPALVVSDALAMAPFLDAALFVADAEASTRGAVTHSRTQLEQVDARLIGAILNNFDPSKGRLSPYYYSYYYQYRYTEEETGRRRRRRGERKELPYPEPVPASSGFERTSRQSRTEGAREDATAGPSGPEGTTPSDDSRLDQLWTSEGDGPRLPDAGEESDVRPGQPARPQP